MSADELTMEAEFAWLLLQYAIAATPWISAERLQARPDWVEKLVVAGLINRDNNLIGLTETSRKLAEELANEATKLVAYAMKPKCFDTVRIVSTGAIGVLIGLGCSFCAVVVDGVEFEARLSDIELVKRHNPNELPLRSLDALRRMVGEL